MVHTITAIELEFRDRVGYYVSDCRVEQPDPFLMVTAPERPARKATNATRCERYFTDRFARSSTALSARREYMTKEGQIIHGGPDHYARLAATKHFRDFLSAGRPAPKQPEKQERRRLTLPELEELLREQEAKKQELNVM